MWILSEEVQGLLDLMDGPDIAIAAAAIVALYHSFRDMAAVGSCPPSCAVAVLEAVAATSRAELLIQRCCKWSVVCWRCASSCHGCVAHGCACYMVPLLVPLYGAAASAFHQIPAALLCFQDPEPGEAMPSVSMAFSNPGDRLGVALQKPDMISAAAAWDSCAVPALCLLAIGSSHPSERNRLQLQLQLALAECLRYAQQAGP